MRGRARCLAATLGLLTALSVAGSCHQAPTVEAPTSRPSVRQTPPAAAKATAPVHRRRTVKLVTAGDIACNPVDRRYGIGQGEETGCQQKATSQLIARLKPAAVMPLGDNQYQHGTYRGFMSSYAQTWGRFLAITHPVIGNHEYDTPHAAGYFGYFGRAAGDPRKAYYSYDLGRWHVVVLNDTGCRYVGGCGAGSPQERWLRRDLAADRARCTLAAWHEPRWSSGEHGSNPALQAMWRDMYAAGVDVVVAGHDHHYERFEPLDASGRSDPSRGIRSFVVGTGGVGLRGFEHYAVGSVVREHDTFGVLALSLHPSGYSWRFVPVGDSFNDRGRGRCH
jgi:acid phosphatase type 7